MRFGSSQGNAANAIPIYLTANAAAGIKPVTGNGLVPAIVAKAAAGASYGVSAGLPSGTAAAWVIGYNALTVPADGPVNPALVLEAAPVVPGAGVTLLPTIATSYTVGIVYYLTSGANPYANKVSVSGFLSAKVI